MTRDDIIRMAVDAGGRFHGPNIEHLSISEEDFLSKLAPALLAAGAAAEREKMAINSIHSCHSECQRPICVLVREAVEAERDECAHLAVLWQNFDLAAAIRARGAS